MASSAASSNPSSVATLAPVMAHLLDAALSEGTERAYIRAILSYVEFNKTNFPTCKTFPAPAGVLAAFIASLYSRHYAPATLMTYVSALSYIHKLAGQVDPTQLCVIKKLLAGAHKLSGKPDTHLPISPTVLHKIVDATKYIVSSAYLRNMSQSIFLLAFQAFLRIGEISVHSRTRGDLVMSRTRGDLVTQLGVVTISSTGITLVMSHTRGDLVIQLGDVTISSTGITLVMSRTRGDLVIQLGDVTISSTDITLVMSRTRGDLVTQLGDVTISSTGITLVMSRTRGDLVIQLGDVTISSTDITLVMSRTRCDLVTQLGDVTISSTGIT